MWRGTGGGRPEKRGEMYNIEEGTGSGRNGKNTQHCTVFRNRKNAKTQELANTGREPGLKCTGSGKYKPPLHLDLDVKCLHITSGSGD